MESQSSQADRFLNVIRNVTVKDDDFEKKMLIFKICVGLVIKNVGTIRKSAYEDFYDVMLKVYNSIIPWLRIYEVLNIKDLDTENYKAKLIEVIEPKMLQLFEEKYEEILERFAKNKNKYLHAEKIFHKRLINLPKDVLKKILSEEDLPIDS